MIKSKIDARERALEFVVSFAPHLSNSSVDDLIKRAKMFESYLIGDAELPEVTDDNAHIKELLEIANKSFDNSRKCNNDMIDYILKGDNVDVMSEIPCKSDVEQCVSNDKVNWEQAKVDAAIGAMTAMLASPELMKVVTNPSNVVEKSFEGRVAKLSAQYADAIITELKKTNETK